VAACGETNDAPTVPGEVATPVRGSSDGAAVKEPSVLPEAIVKPTTKAIVPGSAEEKAAIQSNTTVNKRCCAK